ncbi:hypothetical protein [Erythrobacter sp. CCH5-A1]|jgi:hypothetical protein|uniref:hypothetical protein n=1 Tax=Erythrobacter sp. CCH5-A1 TaxID=1768792 RepID=UPI000A94DB47|nr:hypothetical protein [Erythrobacter sp. CCH5-A1]
MTDLASDHAIAAHAAKVQAACLPKVEWTHAGHFAYALWCLRHAPDSATPEAMRETIMALNDAHGTPNTDSAGYHHTITIASLHAAQAVLEAHPGAPLGDVLAALMAGRFGRSDWILDHWSREVLFTPAARRDWIAPDRAPLPTARFG